MSRVIVGRIFWKELRSQRSLWLGVAGLVIVVQAFLTVYALYYREAGQRHDPRFEIVLAAWLGTTFYAIGSGAASFTEETEGSTGSLLRSVPLSSGEAFLGKWGFSLGSAGVLCAVLAVAGWICFSVAWYAARASGWGPPQYEPFALDFLENAAARANETFLTVLGANIGIAIGVPLTFFAFCALYSLLVSDGVIAAICGTVSAIGVLILSAMLAWDPRLGVLPTEFAPRLGVIAFALVVVDYWLTGVWLGQGGPGRLRWTGQWPIEWTGRWPIEWTRERKSYRMALPGPIGLLRFGEPKAVWVRGVQRLLWKELRQAWPYFAISLVAATVLALPQMHDVGIGRLAPWLVGLAAPLIMGVGSYHVEQKGAAFRLLANQGVPAEGSWLIKHTVWMGLAAAVFAYAALLTETGQNAAYRLRDSIFYAFGTGMAWRPTSNSLDSMLTQTNWPLAAFYILLAYSIAQRMSFAVRKGILAFGLAMGGSIIACQVWTLFASWRLPLWWTVGPIPAVLFAYTLTHTERWRTQQLYSYKWSLIAVWIVLPFVGIALALILWHLWLLS